MTFGRIVSKSININASSSKVWEALTNPNLMKQWMMDAEIEIKTNWEPGSPIIISGKMNGHFEYKGTILQFEPEKILRYNSWTKISRLPDLPENYSVIEFRLTEGNQTELTVIQSNLIAEAAYEHANFYWTSALNVLKHIAES